MKKKINIDDPLTVLSEKIRKQVFVPERLSLWYDGRRTVPAAAGGRVAAKKTLLFVLFILLALRVAAPDQRSFFIFEKDPVEPFNDLLYAIGMVETQGNVNAFNPIEQAAGIFQIRPVRVIDYNNRTGSNYNLKDMFDYEISKKVFLYYASRIGPYNYEQIARRWNGSGPNTILYWNMVKEYL